jgi:hypothetical protein
MPRSARNGAEALAAVLSGADGLAACGALQLCQGRYLELSSGLRQRPEFLDRTELRRQVVTLEQDDFGRGGEWADPPDRL